MKRDWTPFANLYAVVSRTLLGRSAGTNGEVEAIPLGATGQALIATDTAAEAVDELGLADVAVSGSYNDLSDLPSASGIGGSTGGTDNRALRSDGTGGATLQASGVTIDDTGNVITAGYFWPAEGLRLRNLLTGRYYIARTDDGDGSTLHFVRSDNAESCALAIQVNTASIKISAQNANQTLGFTGSGAPIDITPAYGGGVGLVRLGRRDFDGSQYVGAGLQVWTCDALFDPGNTPAINVLAPGGGTSVFMVDKTGKTTLAAGLIPCRVTFSTLPSASANQDMLMVVTDRTGRPLVKSDGGNWLKMDGTTLT